MYDFRIAGKTFQSAFSITSNQDITPSEISKSCNKMSLQRICQLISSYRELAYPYPGPTVEEQTQFVYSFSFTTSVNDT
ncbi:hypothetical protein Tco_0361838, partial [Tanacetum coccineum]